MLGKKYLGIELDKNEDIRCGFEKFINTSIEDIPQEYLVYGAMDVIATLHIYYTLCGQIAKYDTKKTLLSQQIQVKGELALAHIHKNGIHFNLSMRDSYLEKANKQLHTISERLAQ